MPSSQSYIKYDLFKDNLAFIGLTLGCLPEYRGFLSIHLKFEGKQSKILSRQIMFDTNLDVSMLFWTNKRLSSIILRKIRKFYMDYCPSNWKDYLRSLKIQE
jgi:hypothetical protein